MNTDEAKVPNVEKDWQSIEIFLFSNGQQYSPPRKYRLRVDELNLWDTTLNQLAQSHYGLQSPFIHLYTTNGQQVKGPLDLRDGQAYVAVVPPDTFVDAGYQKYLIRASRSWEKRQARKKPQECVPDEPCCLCPERERSCCDPQACCLCPEREDANSLEDFLPATGHPELRPAGGHYMSSAPAKPVAADDYEPVSGKIGRMSCEHCENRASLPEYGYSPVPTTDNPNGYVSKPDEYAARRSENETRQRVNGAMPDEFGARPAEYGARQGEYEIIPSVNEVKTGEYGAGPGDETKPSVNGTKLSEYDARPSLNGVKPGEYGARPAEYETRPSLSGGRPGEFGARPAEYGARQGEYEIKPSVNGVKTGEYGAGPGDETKPSVNGTKLSEYDARPSLNGVKPGEYGARPAEYETRPSLNGGRPGEFGARPAEYGARQGEYEIKPSVNGVKTGEYGAGPGDETKPSVNGTKLGEYGAKTSLNGVKPGEYGARPAEYESRPSFNGVNPSQFGAKPADYETIPSANEIEPGEYGVRLGEYETRPSLNGAKPGEFGARPAEYGVRPGDYETKSTVNGTIQAEYETRPSVNGITHAKYENVYRPIPGEFETKASINGANQGEYGMRRDENKTKPGVNGVNRDEVGTKPAEYETKPRVNGAKPGEHGARQIEYKTKPIGNEPKPDDFLTRPVEYATRSAEQENRPDEYVCPAKNGSWSGEYGDRTTNHKARPGHSGPWSGNIDPIKEAYETALRENEKRLKENEDRPDKDTVIKDASIKYVNEYRKREVDQRDKEIEPKDWARGNGGRGGEHRVSGSEKNTGEKDTVTGAGETKARKNENARRLSARGGAEIEQGARTAEPSRGFEHGNSVSAQKAREINPAGRASGQARLSVQKNKQSDNVTRVGGRENRVGDHEARAGDIGFQTIGHDAGLENTGSTEAEPGARAAVSGFRGSPRDRVNSRPKTGHLGQPRIGKPGTKIDEAAVKLDDLGFKQREGNPGARQNRVGATGTAGVLNISEAQQHARRNTLSTGRPSVEKKRLSIGQNSTLPRKPHPNSSILRKSEDRQPIKSNKENQPKKMNEKASPAPVSASNDTGKIKTPALPPSTISITNIASVTTDKNPFDNVIDEKEIIVVSTHSLKNPESETKSMLLDSVKHVVGAINSSQEETQTELIYIERSMAYVSVNEGVQTNTEEVEKQGQEMSTSKEKDNSCTCSLCRHSNHKTSEPDENTLSILNKGGVVNIKLNIEVRNIVKSVYSCQKNCGRSQSLINVPRPEKKSEISIEDDVVLNHTSLQSLFTKQNFGGFGFEGSPKVMVVQCAGCGRLNTPPQCDPPPCCDGNKKYFVLLNSVLEDKENGCNFNPPCRPCDQRQSRRQSSGIPIKQAFSETILDTITTVTVSGVPLQRREMGKCGTNTACQTEEPQNESMTTKRKVSISQDSVTKCDLQKKSSSSDCVATQAVSLLRQQSCLKMFSQKFEYEDSQMSTEICRAVRPPTCDKIRSVCSHVRPPTCEKVRPNCSQVPSLTCAKVSPPSCENVQSDFSQVPPSTCEKVRSICSHVRPQTCEKVQPKCSQVPPPICEKVSPPSCENVQSDCSQVPPSTCENVQPDCSQVRPPKCENVRSDCSQEPLPICEKVRSVCLQVSPPTCEKVRSLCSQVSSQTFSQVQTKECQPLGPQIQSQGCQPTCRPRCPKPPPQVPQHSNAETQTQWTSILLQARLHCDGRYSFHLPPLHLLKSNCHSSCQ